MQSERNVIVRYEAFYAKKGDVAPLELNYIFIFLATKIKHLRSLRCF